MAGLEPQLEPATSRVGGGRSARIAAAGFVAVLLATAWIGLSGREPVPEQRAALPPLPTTPAQASPARVAGGASPSVPPPPSPRPTHGHEPARPMIVLGEDKFAVYVTVDDRHYLRLLDETSNGRLQATVRLSPLDQEAMATMEIVQLWARGGRNNYASVGTWPVPLYSFGDVSERSVLVSRLRVAARPRLTGEPRLVRDGFSLIVRAQSRDYDYLIVEVLSGDSVPTMRGGLQPLRLAASRLDAGMVLPR